MSFQYRLPAALDGPSGDAESKNSSQTFFIIALFLCIDRANFLLFFLQIGGFLRGAAVRLQASLLTAAIVGASNIGNARAPALFKLCGPHSTNTQPLHSEKKGSDRNQPGNFRASGKQFRLSVGWDTYGGVWGILSQ